jgi:F-type H+-transporting ATPase subunit c
LRLHVAIREFNLEIFVQLDGMSWRPTPKRTKAVAASIRVLTRFTVQKETQTMSKKNLALATATLTTLISSSAFAQGAEAAAASPASNAEAMAALGAGLAIGLAVLGGGLGQGKAAAAALEGISRNPGAAPRIQTPMILGLALIESLVLFAFLIAYLLQGKVG